MTKRTGLIGTKIGNSSYYDDSGQSLPVTILKINECIVSGVKQVKKMPIHQFNFFQQIVKKK